MSRYLVLWKANPSAWPTDPKQLADILDGVTGAGSAMLASGAIAELGWLTPQEGYAVFEADSKAAVLGMVQGFFPLYTQDIHEIVPWEEGRTAILDSARQAAAL